MLHNYDWLHIQKSECMESFILITIYYFNQEDNE